MDEEQEIILNQMIDEKEAEIQELKDKLLIATAAVTEIQFQKQIVERRLTKAQTYTTGMGFIPTIQVIPMSSIARTTLAIKHKRKPK